MILIVEPDRVSLEALTAAVGPGALELSDVEQARRQLGERGDIDVVLLGSGIHTAAALALAESMRLSRPWLGVVLVRRNVDTSTLTEALRAGVREVVQELDVVGTHDAVSRSQQLARSLRDQAGAPAAGGDEPSRGRVTTVFSAKGGCGKTTLATNLAAALAADGRRQVCLVDLDLAFGDVAIAMQLFPSRTLADAVGLADSIDESAVGALLTHHSPGLSALVAPMEPGSSENIPAALVGRVIAVLRGMFDHIVIDTPPSFTDHVLAAFDASDVMALVTTLDVPALKNLKLTLETLDLLSYSREHWRVVLNRSDSKVGLAVSEVEKVLRVPIAVEIPSSRSVPASINRGVPIVLDEPNHPVSVAIRRLAESLVAEGQHDPGDEPQAEQRRFALRRRAVRAS
ncbi:MAG TPA: P-loop NTPase [Mycobacteriales bacterium]|nr:P-loop NTPase [Mycobacteriales bacterium]